MRLLGVTDTIFFNLGHRYITSTVVLEGPCDLDRFTAQMDAATLAYPPLRERVHRIGPWFAARRDPHFDIANHVCAVDVPEVTTTEDLLPIIEKARRTVTPQGASPWCAYVINPASDTAPPAGAAEPLSAVIFQLKHGLADGTRCGQILNQLENIPTAPAHDIMARVVRLSRAAFNALPEHDCIEDAGVSLLRVPRERLRKDRSATGRLVRAATELVADETLFAHDKPLNNRVARTRFMRRRTASGELGNHLETIAEETGPSGQGKRGWRLPGLSQAQKLPLSQYIVALSPPPIARYLMRKWYASFDAIVTVLPMPSMALGGRKATAVYGVPPLSGAIPLVILASPTGTGHAIVAVRGTSCHAETGAFLARLGELLTEPKKTPTARKQRRSQAKAPWFENPASPVGMSTHPDR